VIPLLLIGALWTPIGFLLSPLILPSPVVVLGVVAAEAAVEEVGDEIGEEVVAAIVARKVVPK
jgi:hypothetical protein